MGRVTVKRNEFPRIIRELPKAVDEGARDTADSLAQVIESRVWRLRGFVKQASFERSSTKGALWEVVCGINRSTGFYSRFNEWGTVKQAPRPVVGPAAHEFEPRYAQLMANQIRRVCG